MAAMVPRRTESIATQLLVSVRSAAEAEEALAGGAALIDVKEPANGPLGKAPDRVIGDVIRRVAGRVPVSAAMGEFREFDKAPAPDLPAGLAFLKLAFARCGGEDWPGWSHDLRGVVGEIRARQESCRVALAAYADWRNIHAPTPFQVCHLACDLRAGAFLVDTCGKDGSTLLDSISMFELDRLCRQCQEAGVPIALAGALGAEQIRVMLPLRPNWFAVRGAACQGGHRAGSVDRYRVRNLVELIEGVSAAIPAG
jgi:uncharacterized protein (UPF0264 family)